MVEDRRDSSVTLALGTKLEEEFVAPLTAVRGALEILRDHPDINEAERQRFVSTALRSCNLLERAVHDLADTVYAAGRAAYTDDQPAVVDESDDYTRRIGLFSDLSMMELDFNGLVFSNSQIVNDMYNAIEAEIKRSGRKWYFLINMTDCSIWPEAWVAFAHRGKKISVNHALGTVRYTESNGHERVADVGPDTPQYPSRASAIAQVKKMAGQNA